VGIEDEVRRRALVDHLEVVVFRRLENVNRRLVDDIADGLAVFFWLAGDQIDACEWHSIAPCPVSLGIGAAARTGRYYRYEDPGLTVSPFRSILSSMVNYNERLDRTFAALVDPTRRAILARLEREDGASISALAQPFAIKLPAVMKHLDVLGDAGLVTRSKVGRTVTVRLRPEPMREAMDWLRRYERFWSKSLDRLAAYAESKEAEARKKRR
jgi:DNA-binding transcriptional ArsR family regulator